MHATSRKSRNVQFPFALLCQMCWSKNTLEERDASDQLLLGAADRHNRRKVFRDKGSEMVRAGWNAMNAVDRIYEVYGRHTSVTS
jgi:hypothetical protein